MVAYIFEFDHIIGKLEQPDGTFDKRSLLNALIHLGYCMMNNGVVLSDNSNIPAVPYRIPEDTSTRLYNLYRTIIGRNESDVPILHLINTLQENKVEITIDNNVLRAENTEVLTINKLVNYAAGLKEKRRNELLQMQHFDSDEKLLNNEGKLLTKENKLLNYLSNFIRYSGSCYFCEPHLAEWLLLEKNGDDRKIKGMAKIVKELTTINKDLSVTLVTKSVNRDIKGLAFLSQEIGDKAHNVNLKAWPHKTASHRVDVLNHDRFLVNDRFFCSFGSGFDLYRSERYIREDLNVYWGGPKSKFGNMWESIKKQEAIATF